MCVHTNSFAVYVFAMVTALVYVIVLFTVAAIILRERANNKKNHQNMEMIPFSIK